MADQFKVGDIVQLKSGGPRMTVESVEATNSLFCVWFDETEQGNSVRVHAFRTEVLAPA